VTVELIAFLGKAIGVSLSGVLAPGAMTAATLAAAPRNRHAGALVALGHAAVEMPLMVLIVAGFSYWFKRPDVKVAVGLAGGAILLVMAAGMFRGAMARVRHDAPATRRGPLLTGIVLTAGNPLFLLWWAGAGLGLAVEAASLGVAAFVIFACTHWLLDLIWLETLTLTAHKGSTLFGEKAQRLLLILCGAAMVIFGARFIYVAALVAWS